MMDAGDNAGNPTPLVSPTPHPPPPRTTYSGRYQQLDVTYRKHQAILLGNLSRFNNLLFIVNISLFFLTGLVAQGYYFTFISIGCLTLVAVLLVLPLPAMDRFGFYAMCLFIEVVGMYFLIASIVYRVQHSGYSSPPI